ncbi:MAG: sigma factor-like helix-turn-helix DNA-binding protein [Thermoguttaceae bacterium]
MNQHGKLQEWVEEMARLCGPDQIVWIDGSEEEKERLTQEAVAAGEVQLPDQENLPGCLGHRGVADDVARTEDLTFICTTPQDDTWPANNRMSPGDDYRRAGEMVAGSMRGRTMYVIPFSMGPIGSPFSTVGVKLTDSIYVVLNMRGVANVGTAVLEQLGADGEFAQCPYRFDNVKSHPWQDFERAFQVVIAALRTGEADSLEFDRAMREVVDLVQATAQRLLANGGIPNAWHAGCDAAERWWGFMRRKGGGFDQYVADRPFYPFGFAKLKFLCLDLRRNIFEHDRRQTALGFEPEDNRCNPVRDASRKEEAEMVRHAMLDLPPDHRQVLVWEYWDQLNLAEVARQLGICAATLYTRSFRAKATLRRKLPGLDWNP